MRRAVRRLIVRPASSGYCTITGVPIRTRL